MTIGPTDDGHPPAPALDLIPCRGLALPGDAFLDEPTVVIRAAFRGAGAFPRDTRGRAHIGIELGIPATEAVIAGCASLAHAGSAVRGSTDECVAHGRAADQLGRAEESGSLASST